MIEMTLDSCYHIDCLVFI